MGEKETMAAEDAAQRSGTLNVSATPGGSVAASLAGAGANPPVQGATDASGERSANPLYAEPPNAGEMPNI